MPTNIEKTFSRAGNGLSLKLLSSRGADYYLTDVYPDGTKRIYRIECAGRTSVIYRSPQRYSLLRGQNRNAHVLDKGNFEVKKVLSEENRMFYL
ncbi:MAG: hypothetical protein A3C30_05330 [Candidatus Levybacteria bacterium RIFCSPHIGHO2_02_FULL_40_18]|nr:MAG: hypothetical protein A2869_02990 [Candidatus Levybacteria bacterium RIFCSPHIGHO2_01_FULL_40_58]OGH26497.1 MAG: hypothetical protein A3C30_05330 [Candidatus Levybacteria bacterium RIFCSPHIGHO2_02_FULL_40_18]OGH31945.1 MAG: hypothetical protein A3E43_01130 [Candidatus Levybacteria bacterium RIFCSPHIGHO2_12_FULL_40_31]OGH40214.1 MAG: hypothetical protein A2894_05225 [Candidatus Levybacteria bacterium RIFCSPLOWO2_01_FULL_40_64]OGH49338.1 MAG: hypothetical protein A3I54_01675 [Candidatus Lev